MTLRVYRVGPDGERELVREQDYDPAELPLPIASGDFFPPCDCADCRLRRVAR